MSFKDEMEQRLRRICGVTDDTLDVSIETATETITHWQYMSCEYDETNSWTIVKVVRFYDKEHNKYWKDTVAEKKFKDLGELMRALDEVEL